MRAHTQAADKHKSPRKINTLSTLESEGTHISIELGRRARGVGRLARRIQVAKETCISRERFQIAFLPMKSSGNRMHAVCIQYRCPSNGRRCTRVSPHKGQDRPPCCRGPRSSMRLLSLHHRNLNRTCCQAQRCRILATHQGHTHHVIFYAASRGHTCMTPTRILEGMFPTIHSPCTTARTPAGTPSAAAAAARDECS